MVMDAFGEKDCVERDFPIEGLEGRCCRRGLSAYVPPGLRRILKMTNELASSLRDSLTRVIFKVDRGGIEPPTHGFSGRCSTD